MGTGGPAAPGALLISVPPVQVQEHMSGTGSEGGGAVTVTVPDALPAALPPAPKSPTPTDTLSTPLLV